MKFNRSGVRQWVIGLIAACSVVLSGAALAQDTAPINSLATLEAGEFSSLAITRAGQRMLVADTANNTARLYDISDPENPVQLDSIMLEGRPLALAPTSDYAITIVDLVGRTDLVQVIAPALFNPRAGWEAYPLMEVPSGTIDFAVDFGGTWGGLIVEDRLLLLELIDAANVNSLVVPLNTPPAAVDLTDRVILLALRESPAIERYALRSGPEVARLRPYLLDAPVRDMDISDNGDMAVAALENGQILIFDPQSNEPATVLISGDIPTDHVQLLSDDGQTWLALGINSESRVEIYAIGDDRTITEQITLDLNAPLRAITSYGNLLALSEGSSIRLFRIEL